MRSLGGRRNGVIQRADTARQIGRSIGHRQLRDCFQGALLGIHLLPTALCPIRAASDWPSDLSLARSRIQQAVDCSLAQTRSFVLGPNDWTVDLGLQNPALLLPACVPVLLRYHDSWRRRFDRLMLLQLQMNSLQADAARVWLGAIAQSLMVGDLLEVLSFDDLQLASKTDWLAWLTDCAERYRIAPSLHAQYEALLCAMRGAGAIRAQPGDALGDDDESRRSFVVGVRSALNCPESYVLAVQCLSGYPSNRTAVLGDVVLGDAAQTDGQEAARATEAIASDWTAAFVAGLLSGAFGGGSSLPALWRARLDVDIPQDLAARLFSLWAGELSSASLSD